MQDKISEEYLEFLDDLRDSGVTNMLGAASYLREAFPKLSKSESYSILSYWMDSFKERHTQ